MSTTIQARLDEKTKEALDRLIVSEGWSPSEAVRECIREAEQRRRASAPRKLIGVGMFSSGIGGLATNKAHLLDFGVKSMGKGWQRPDERGGRRSKVK